MHDDFNARFDRLFSLRQQARNATRAKGRLEVYEAKPIKAMPILPDDSERISYIKTRANGDFGSGFRPDLGELYIERNVTAAELAKAWEQQGWTTLVIRRTHMGHEGPRWHQQVIKLMERFTPVDQWVMEPVERCWSTVVGTKDPRDIEPFKALLLPRDR